jgi:hypothetical protein
LYNEFSFKIGSKKHKALTEKGRRPESERRREVGDIIVEQHLRDEVFHSASAVIVILVLY